MTPTSDQLKDLLGKVTQGTWQLEIMAHDDRNGDEYPCDVEVASDCGRHIHGHDLGYNDEVDIQLVANATLIALAPTLAAEVVRLREALGFYAEFHQDPNAGPWGMNSNDYGNIARQALAEK